MNAHGLTHNSARARKALFLHVHASCSRKRANFLGFELLSWAYLQEVVDEDNGHEFLPELIARKWVERRFTIVIS